MTDNHILPELTDPVEKVVPPTLEELLKDLKMSREERDRAKVARDQRLKELQEDPTYKLEAENYAIEFKRVEELEARIKAMAGYSYMQSGKRDFGMGILDKDFKTFAIEDRVAAIEWAMKHLPMSVLVDPKNEEVRELVSIVLPETLVLDEGAIKTYANKIGEVPGVKIGTEVQFQLASKLP